MPILTPEVLPVHGPYIELAALPRPLDIGEGDWPGRAMYRAHVFFGLADDLAGTICSLSGTYLFFDPYGFTQFASPEAAFGFAAGILARAAAVASCPVVRFDRETGIYEGSGVPEACRTRHHLKADLCATLIYIAERSTAAIRDGKCLAVIGI